jgi:hypothetical protein
MNETKHYWHKSSRKIFFDKGSNQRLQIRLTTAFAITSPMR